MGRIKELIFEVKEYQYKKPFHITNSIKTSSKVINVELRLDTGAKGIGQSSPSFRVNGEEIGPLFAFREAFLREIEGIDVKEFRKIFDITDKFSRTAPSLKAAVQYSVLDALSEEVGIPVFMILGGKKDRVESDLTISIGTKEESVSEAIAAYNEGFRKIKIKVGENLSQDIERVISIKEALPNASFVVDANLGYTPKEAIIFSDVMYKNSVPIDVFEQPVSVNDFEGLKLVRWNSKYPIGADESVKSKEDALRLVKMDCVDFINIKLMKSGISDALSIIEIAKAANVSLMIGSMGESGKGINQSVQFAAGTGAFVHHDLDTFFLLKGTNPYKFKTEKSFLIPER